MVINSSKFLLLHRSSLLASLAFKRTTHIRYLASSQQYNHLHFHQNLNNFSEQKVKTGLFHRQELFVKSLNYLQSFHRQQRLFIVNYSNFAGQKVNQNSDKNNTKNDIKQQEEDRCMKDDAQKDENKQPKVDEKPLTLVGKFKKMAKEYWYVLIPVHVVTSIGWIGGFYYASVNGVDIVGIMESLHFSETIISKLRDSTLGHFAIAYLLYKIASPARYAVTVGGTTYAINILASRGIIKPMPTRDELVQMYKDKKDDIQQKIEDKIEETKLKVEETKEKVADKKEELYQKLEDKKQDIQMKLEEKKQDIQQKVADKKQEIGEKLKGRN